MLGRIGAFGNFILSEQTSLIKCNFKQKSTIFWIWNDGNHNNHQDKTSEGKTQKDMQVPLSIFRKKY